MNIEKRQKFLLCRVTLSTKLPSLHETFFSLSLSGASARASSPKSSEFPILKQIPKDEILKQVTSEARNLKRRRELPSQKNVSQFQKKKQKYVAKHL